MTKEAKQVEENKLPTAVICPKGEFGNLTPGKEYKITWTTEFGAEYCETNGYAINIVSDCGFKLFCNTKECAHLDNKNWILK